MFLGKHISHYVPVTVYILQISNSELNIELHCFGLVHHYPSCVPLILLCLDLNLKHLINNFQRKLRYLSRDLAGETVALTHRALGFESDVQADTE